MKIFCSLAILLSLITVQWMSAQVIYSNEQVDVIRLDDNIFLLKENFKFSANCVVVAGDNGLLLLDSGFGEVGEYLVDALKALGKEVKVIVNSHGHSDHIGANPMFGKDVLVIGHKNCTADFEQSGQKLQLVEQNHTFDFAGNLVFCMAYTGGHSNCDIMTFIPDLNLAYLGDLFLSESFPLVVIGSGSSVETLMMHLNEIFQSLPAETRMIPGHGKATNLEYFGGYIGLLEETIEVVRSKMKSGWSLEKIQSSDVLKKWDQWGHFFPFITKDTWIEQIYLSYSR